MHSRRQFLLPIILIAHKAILMTLGFDDLAIGGERHKWLRA